MKNIHLVIADLFLPQHFAAEACAGLRLPALEKMLARGDSAGPAQTAAGSLEELLCEAFGLPRRDDVPIAPVSAMFDGLGGGCDTLLMKPLATRLGEPTTLAKSLVMAKPADCGSRCRPHFPHQDASQHRVRAAALSPSRALFCHRS